MCVYASAYWGATAGAYYALEKNNNNKKYQILF